MTLRKYRRIGQLAVGAVFADQTQERWPCGAPADDSKCGGAAQPTRRDLSWLFVLGEAGSTPIRVSLQGHHELFLHIPEHRVGSSC